MLPSVTTPYSTLPPCAVTTPCDPALPVSLQLQQAKQTVKVDNPAHLDSISNCIDRCRKLQKLGFKVRCTKPKHQILQDIQDDLKWMSQISGRNTLNRSNTTVEEKRSKKRSFRIRRTSVMNRIKEEVDLSEGIPTASTLPRDVALNVARRSENRPQFLGISRSASVNVGSSSSTNSRLERQSLSPPPSSLPSSKKGHNGKANTLRHSPRIKKHSFFHEEGEPAPGETPPVLPRKHRAPKLAGIGKASSSMEYAADDEDVSPPEITSSSSSVGSHNTKSCLPKEPESVVISNTGKTSLSPFQKKKTVSFEQDVGAQTLVAVEVHCNTDASEPGSSSPASRSRDHHVRSPGGHVLGPSRVDQVDLGASVTSQSRLLPDEAERSPRGGGRGQSPPASR